VDAQLVLCPRECVLDESVVQRPKHKVPSQRAAERCLHRERVLQDAAVVLW
jgi:hypothetical protein